MDGKHPLISVIIPAYNAEAFITQTLESVLGQTYPNIEVLVVDDGSQDQTAAIIQGFVHRDSRVTLFQQSNQGVAAARNLAIQKSRGAYISPIDADDIWYPQKLEKQVQCLATADASVGLVYAWSAHIDEAGLLTGAYIAWSIEGKVYLPLMYSNFVGNASAPLIRRSCLTQVGNYNCTLREQNAQGCEDRDLYLRIAEQYEFRVVPEFLIGYRQVIGSMACNYLTMENSHQLIMADIQKRYPAIPAILYQWARSNFYYYLGWRSNNCGMHWNTLVWLSKALQWDLALLLRRHLYVLLVKNFLKLFAQPLTRLVWKDHRAWLQFKRKFKVMPQKITVFQISKRQNFRQRFSKFSQRGYRLKSIQHLGPPEPNRLAILN